MSRQPCCVRPYENLDGPDEARAVLMSRLPDYGDFAPPEDEEAAPEP